MSHGGRSAANPFETGLPFLQRQSLAAKILAPCGILCRTQHRIPSTLQSVAKQEGHVEKFRLANFVLSNKLTGMNLYIDEIGLLKRSPLNQRAMDLAQ